MESSHKYRDTPATIYTPIPGFVSLLPPLLEMPGTRLPQNDLFGSSPGAGGYSAKRGFCAAFESYTPHSQRTVLLTPSAGARILSAVGELSTADLPTTCPPFEFWLLKKLDRSVCVFDYWVRGSQSWDTEGILSDLTLARTEAEAVTEGKVGPSQLNTTGNQDSLSVQRVVSIRE